MVIAHRSNVTLTTLMPSPLLFLKIFMICGTLTSNEPAIILSPRHLLKVVLKHSAVE